MADSDLKIGPRCGSRSTVISSISVTISSAHGRFLLLAILMWLSPHCTCTGIPTDVVAEDVNGLTLNSFQGMATMRQLQCSGDRLEPDKDLLTLVLYDVETNVIMAYVHPYKEECLTWDRFSACQIYKGDSRRTRLRCLVTLDKVPRTFGCNVTFTQSGKTSWLSWSLVVKGAGMRVHPFAGSDSIVQLECTGRALASDSDLLSLAVYTKRGSEDESLVSVNLRNSECSTSHLFASCVIDGRDTKATRVTVLITDLTDRESRNYGCKATSVGQGGLPRITTWFLTVSLIRLSAKVFQGLPTVQEVTCSGRTSNPDIDLLSLVLYEKKEEGEVLATANLKSGECSMRSHFTSCVKDEKKPHETYVKVLVSGLLENETKRLGCDVTTLKSGDRTRITTWSLKVTGKSNHPICLSLTTWGVTLLSAWRFCSAFLFSASGIVNFTLLRYA